MLESIYKQADEKFLQCIEVLHREFTGLRSGRATVSMLDGIKVMYYDTPTPLTQVATLSAPEPGMLSIQPWDTSVIKDIEKAIMKSDLGLTPQNDGKLIRIPIPTLTEERRKDLCKVVKRLAEEAKVSVRNIRRDILEHLKKMEKNKEITEDDHRHGQAKIQELVDKYTKQITSIQEHKEKEILGF